MFAPGVEVGAIDFGATCTDPSGTLTYPGARYVECPGMRRALVNEYGWGYVGGRWATGEECG